MHIRPRGEKGASALCPGAAGARIGAAARHEWGAGPSVGPSRVELRGAWHAVAREKTRPAVAPVDARLLSHRPQPRPWPSPPAAIGLRVPAPAAAAAAAAGRWTPERAGPAVHDRPVHPSRGHGVRLVAKRRRGRGRAARGIGGHIGAGRRQLAGAPRVHVAATEKVTPSTISERVRGCHELRTRRGDRPASAAAQAPGLSAAAAAQNSYRCQKSRLEGPEEPLHGGPNAPGLGAKAVRGPPG
jgi:hypothetical protein